MDQQKRMMLALALVFALTTVYTLFFAPKNSPVAELALDAGVAAGPVQTVATVPALSLDAGAVAVAEGHVSPETTTIDLPQANLALSNMGAGLSKAELVGPKMREQPRLTLADGLSRLAGKKGEDGPPIDMALRANGEPLPLSFELTGAVTVPFDQPFEIRDRAPGKVVFFARRGPLEITKRFEWAAPFAEGTEHIELHNTGAQALRGDLSLFVTRGVVPGSEEKASFLGSVGNESIATCMVGDDVKRKGPDGKPAIEQDGPVGFFGISQQYFLSAAFSLDGAKAGHCELEATAAMRRVKVTFPLEIAAGQTQTLGFGTYVGPKDVEILRTAGERWATRGLKPGSAGEPSWSSRLNASSYPFLEKTVDFGMWAAICKLLLGVLKFFHSLVHNWGVAIILLTVMVKLALLPLTHKSMVSAQQMKKLQPKIEALRAKYPDDRERQNVEMMKLYQENKVNPLGGCLPMLLQMPVWIALYSTLRNSYELYREPFISPLWSDLTYKDPTYLLPLALGVTMLITQRFQPQMMDGAQAKVMLYVMPVFFTLIMMNYPAGLSLYIFTNNVLSIGQQYALNRYLERTGVAPPREERRRSGNERAPTNKRSNP